MMQRHKGRNRIMECVVEQVLEGTALPERVQVALAIRDGKKSVVGGGVREPRRSRLATQPPGYTHHEHALSSKDTGH